MWRWAVRAVLALILVALVIVRFRPRQPSYGFPVQLPTRACDEPEVGVYHRCIFLRLLPHGRTFLNWHEIPQDDIPDRLADIYRGRKDKSIYFAPEEGVSYQEIITLLDKIEGKGLGMSIILIVPSK